MPCSTFSITQVSRELNVSENTARRLIKAGKIRASRIGEQWRVFESDIKAYVDSRQIGRSIVRRVANNARSSNIQLA